MNAKKIVLLVLTFSFFLFSLAGCSTMKNIIGWVNFWDSNKTKANLTDKDVARFVSNVRSNRGNPDSHYLLACYYQERGKHKEAIEEFKKVLFIDPNYVKAYNGLGVSYDLLGDFPRAIEFYKNALKLNPNLDYVQNNLGYSYLLQENFDEAIAVFKRAMELNDKDKRFHNNLGLAYAEKGQFDLALGEFKLAGEEAKAHYNIAQVYLKKGLYNEAMSYYTTALRLDPFLTCARTALEAASTLSRVFHSDTKSTKAEELVTPEKPNQIPPSPPFLKGGEEGFGFTPVEVKAEKSIAQDERFDASDHAELEAANAVATIFLPATKEAEPDELAVPESVSVAPDTFELQVASFRSKEIADLTANSLRESGYRTTVKDWKDEKGREWHRLFTGPFVTKDEALTRKVRIEKEYKFGPMIVQSKAAPARRSAFRHAGVKTQAEKVVVHSTEKNSLNSLRDVEIEISNGNGVNRMARRVGDYLKGKRLKVVRLTNANNFNYTETRIFYQEGFRQAADYMAEQLPVIRTMEELKRFDRPNIKVKLVIGKDLIQHNKLLEVEPAEANLPSLKLRKASQRS